MGMRLNEDGMEVGGMGRRPEICLVRWIWYQDIPMFLSSELDAKLCPEITRRVARLMPAYSFG